MLTTRWRLELHDNEAQQSLVEWRRPCWLRGALFGAAVWPLAFLAFFACELLEDSYSFFAWLPRWLLRLDLLDRMIKSTLETITAPFAPLEALFFSLPFTLAAYTLIGAAIGHLLPDKWQWRFSLRTLLLVVTVLAIVAGIIAAAYN